MEMTQTVENTGDTSRGAGPAAQRLLVVALDCAERTLIERWMAEGHLPHLNKLHQRGAYGPMSSTADVMVATPWPTAMTSQWPVEHGFVCWMQWRQEVQDERRCDPSWVPWTPFYRRLGPLGKRVIAIDVPMAYPPTPIDGKEIVSWGSYEKLCPVASHPPDFHRHLASQYHKLPLEPNIGELQSIRAQLKLRDRLIAGTEKVGDACRDLMRDESWDLFMVGLGAPHRAGHTFWDRRSFLETDPPARLVEVYDRALRDVYVAADRQLGKMLEVLPESTTVVALATHGMGPNTCRLNLLPTLLDHILHDRKAHADDEPTPKPGLLTRLRYMVPTTWRQCVKRQLPKHAQDALAKFWTGALARDWSKIQAFTLASDLEGSIRVNLRGRERDGIVEPTDFEALLDKIEQGLLSWTDETTGKPLVRQVLRGASLWPEVPPDKRSPSTPDLIVQWSDHAPGATQRIVSPRYGTLRAPVPEKFPDGHSGHHVPTGWLMVAGESIEAGTVIKDARGLDLAPTLMHLMGLEPFAEMRGRVLPETAQPAREPARV